MSGLQTFDYERLHELYYQLAFLKANLSEPGWSLRDAGRFCQEITDTLRGLAIMHLLLDADVRAFAACLRDSAEVRHNHLSACNAAQYVDFYVACNRAEPFFDALACGATDLVAGIASLSPTNHRSGEEYEDDYCYVRFLQLLATGHRAELPHLIGRFRAVLGGASSSRLDICQVLYAKDMRGFDAAFAELLAERDEEVARLRIGRAIEDACAAADTYVFIEGLAIAAIADQLGFNTHHQYRYCPPLARVAASTYAVAAK